MILEVLREWLQLRPEELRFGRMEAAILVATGLTMAAVLLAITLFGALIQINLGRTPRMPWQAR